MTARLEASDGDNLPDDLGIPNEEEIWAEIFREEDRVDRLDYKRSIRLGVQDQAVLQLPWPLPLAKDLPADNTPSAEKSEGGAVISFPTIARAPSGENGGGDAA